MALHNIPTVLETALQALREYEQRQSVTATNPPRHGPDPPHAVNRTFQDTGPVRRQPQGFLHLMSFLGKRVWTPSGPGTLLRVDNHVTVGFEDGTKMRWYDSTAVIPYA